MSAVACKWRLDAELVLPSSVPVLPGDALVVATYARSRAARKLPKREEVRPLRQGIYACTAFGGVDGAVIGVRCVVRFGIHASCVHAHRSRLRRGTLGGWQH